MIDIRFYQEFYPYKQQLMDGLKLSEVELSSILEACRQPDPVIYNIETTNLCNMRCQMCPRTTMMTRKNEELPMDIYKKVVGQIRPWTEDEWNTWQDFVELNYGIDRDEMNENHFFLYIIPQVIQLHGYGSPLLDKNIVGRVEELSAKGIPSYFSCNPSNIGVCGIERDVEIFKAGLDYCKYSIESVDDSMHQEIRGKASDFSQAYNNILEIMNLKERHNLQTTIVITMLDLGREGQQEDWARLKEKFDGLDVYIYFKSEDQQWYRRQYHSTKSIHWLEMCQLPWSSMTIKSNGEIAMCMEDFNNEIILGDASAEALYDVWNSKKYEDFRSWHFSKELDIKCVNACDMKLMADYL